MRVLLPLPLKGRRVLTGSCGRSLEFSGLGWCGSPRRCRHVQEDRVFLSRSCLLRIVRAALDQRWDLAVRLIARKVFPGLSNPPTRLEPPLGVHDSAIVEVLGTEPYVDKATTG